MRKKGDKMNALTPKEFSLRLVGFANSKKDDILKLVGDEKKAEKFTADLSLLSLDPSLVKCSAMSVFTSALRVAQIGLSIVKENKQAFLVPFKNQGYMEAQLQISYIGWRILAKRAGFNINCELVYKCDEFKYIVNENGKNFKFEANLEERENHDKAWVESNLVGAMVWATDSNGTEKEFVSAKKLMQLRSNSPAIKLNRFSAWDDWTEEMFKAKAIKYVASKLPTDTLVQASSYENVVEQKIQEEKQEEQELDLNSLLDENINSETGEVKEDE
jgi:recombination protein RecT